MFGATQPSKSSGGEHLEVSSPQGEVLGTNYNTYPEKEAYRQFRWGPEGS